MTVIKGKKGRPAGQASGGLNKSEEIRKFFEKSPDARTAECITFLAGKNIEVSQALVSSVRGRLSGKTGKSKEVTLSEAMLVKNFIDTSGIDEEVATSILSDFADLIIKCGGVDRFRDILSQYKGFTACAETVSESIEQSESDEDEDEDEDSDESAYEDVNDEEDDE
jgi:hypothetical protein